MKLPKQPPAFVLIAAAFDRSCAFILHLENGRATALETDRTLTATVAGKQLALSPTRPRRWNKVGPQGFEPWTKGL